MRYDLLSRQLFARFVSTTGAGVTYSWDKAGRQLTSTDTASSRTLTYQYDKAGNRTRLTWPDAVYADYVYDVVNRVTAIRENGATSGAGLLATFAYDDLGRRTQVARGNGTATSYGYDGASRLTSLGQDLPGGTAHDVTFAFPRNAAGQVAGRNTTTVEYDYVHPVRVATGMQPGR